MFENISQGMFFSGIAGYLLATGFVRFLSGICIMLFVNRDAKARGNDAVQLWTLAVFAFPVLATIAYLIIRRRAEKQEIVKHQTPKSAKIFFVLSFVLLFTSGVLAVTSIVTMGVGIARSYATGELLYTFCDMNAKEYRNQFDVPLYDRAGNVYVTAESKKHYFQDGYYNENDDFFSKDKSFLDEDGYFYYDESEQLKDGSDGYYYNADGEKFYQIQGSVFWESDGSITDQISRYSEKPFYDYSAE